MIHVFTSYVVSRGIVDSLSAYFQSIKCSLGADTEAVAACEFACQSLIFAGFLLRIVRVALTQLSSARTSSAAAQKTLSLISASSRDLTSRVRVQLKSPVPVHASLVNLSLSSAPAPAPASANTNCNNVGEPQPPVQQQPLASILNSTLNSSLNESNAGEQQQSEAPKSESGAAPDESAPTSRSSKSRRRHRQRERQQSKNSQCDSVGGVSGVGDASAGGVVDGSRELSLADSTRGLHVSSTRTRSGTGNSGVALEDDSSQLLAALAANDLLGVLNALYSMLLSSGSSWRRLLGATANDASPSHRDTSYLLLEVSSALPAECLQPIGSLRVALSAFRFMNELAATNLSILQVSIYIYFYLY